ncbi:hypothetical protein [Bradyrhizobium glycinis]|uniref:hypothetical protein n=1 Tax=Bradyrhizobium glycinis TaxID=2751812 RepID=UPI0018D6D3EE|nr:hypothetical protein [Bradyrhizobium glycinis]MBH5371558.1 hypothetical protein [Bradyrhizobium glycinis]
MPMLMSPFCSIAEALLINRPRMTKWASRSKDTSGRSPDNIGGHKTSILSAPMQAVAEAHAYR